MAAIVDVLVLDELPYDASYLTVCLDKNQSCSMLRGGRAFSRTLGQVEWRDDAYARHGTASLFVMLEPLAGWGGGVSR